MHNLSNGRSGKHILVIQPVLSLHDSIDKNNLRYSDKKIEFLNVYYNEILKSNLCKNYIKCLDLSKMFNNKSNLKSESNVFIHKKLSEEPIDKNLVLLFKPI